jgi:hypothetical protein
MPYQIHECVQYNRPDPIDVDHDCRLLPGDIGEITQLTDCPGTMYRKEITPKMHLDVSAIPMVSRAELDARAIPLVAARLAQEALILIDDRLYWSHDAKHHHCRSAPVLASWLCEVIPDVELLVINRPLVVSVTPEIAGAAIDAVFQALLQRKADDRRLQPAAA